MAVSLCPLESKVLIDATQGALSLTWESVSNLDILVQVKEHYNCSAVRQRMLQLHAVQERLPKGNIVIVMDDLLVVVLWIQRPRSRHK